MGGYTQGEWQATEGTPHITQAWNNQNIILATVVNPEWHENTACASEEAFANAQHIVKCVNSHDDLLEACKISRDKLHHGIANNDSIFDILQQAINKATKGVNNE